MENNNYKTTDEAFKALGDAADKFIKVVLDNLKIIKFMNKLENFIEKISKENK